MTYQEKFNLDDTIAELDTYVSKLPICSERAKLLALGLISNRLGNISNTLNEFLRMVKEDVV